MATRPSESQEMIERWKAEHPELVGRSTSSTPEPRARPAPRPTPAAPRGTREDPAEMIARWRREHPELADGRPRPQPAPRVQSPTRSEESQGRVIDIANTPLTVLGAFIIGCIIGGIAMTIVTGIAFWGFSGA